MEKWDGQSNKQSRVDWVNWREANPGHFSSVPSSASFCCRLRIQVDEWEREGHFTYTYTHIYWSSVPIFMSADFFLFSFTIYEHNA